MGLIPRECILKKTNEIKYININVLPINIEDWNFTNDVVATSLI